MALKKISENIWEIEKEGKMNVSGIIFASDVLMENIKKDSKTIEQVKNVAQLPGIVGKSIAMPDAHCGYGFPIGGVAAFDLEKGIISPGGVGYDINCLSKNTRILSNLGYWKNIEQINKEAKNEKLIILNKEKKSGENSDILLNMNKHSDKIIKVKTKAGLEIFATKDHPFYTEKDMVKIGDIQSGTKILSYPFEGVKYEQPKSNLLIDESKIDNLPLSMTAKLQIKNRLKSLNLLPLHTNNEKIPYLIRIMGFVFGDGYLGLKNTKQVSFYGSKEDLEMVKKDLEILGFKSHLYSRCRNFKMKTQYKEYEFSRVENSIYSSSSSLAHLLFLLGVPSGNKAIQDYNIPSWLMEQPKWYKRLFLASLFGAELSSPRAMTGNPHNLNGLVFSMNKKEPLHGVTFMNQISKLLEEFEVKSILIKNRVDELNGSISTRIRLFIYPDSRNLVNLFSRINYDYNTKKRKLANAAILWLKEKQKIINMRNNTRSKAHAMVQSGFKKKEIIKELSNEYINERFIERSIYFDTSSNEGARIAFCFMNFNEFVDRSCYGNDGFIWDTIESKEEIEYNDSVYDFTINNVNHNFIANSLVVSNCGVRLLASNIDKETFLAKRKEILNQLFRDIPSGVGKESEFSLENKELERVLNEGVKWAVENGYATRDDIQHIEDNGCIEGADASKVSQRAKARGRSQLGSLGSGNHFLEIQEIDTIYDGKIAKLFGINEKGQICIMIHSGSRGLGHQTASDYIMKMEKEYGFKNLPDRELICAPIDSSLGKDYRGAMAAAANFAFVNRQLMTYQTRKVFQKFFPKSELNLVYDIAHNIAKFEEHEVEGKKMTLCVHRKGATRSFGPGRAEIPAIYRDVGCPIFIPGSMGTYSYVLIGTKKAEEISLASTAHGAGRVLSRSYAIKNLKMEDVEKELALYGVMLKTGSKKGALEEAPEAYKDVNEVARVSHELGIGQLVARLRPMAVVKG